MAPWGNCTREGEPVSGLWILTKLRSSAGDLRHGDVGSGLWWHGRESLFILLLIQQRSGAEEKPVSNNEISQLSISTQQWGNADHSV